MLLAECHVHIYVQWSHSYKMPIGLCGPGDRFMKLFVCDFHRQKLLNLHAPDWLRANLLVKNTEKFFKTEEGKKGNHSTKNNSSFN